MLAHLRRCEVDEEVISRIRVQLVDGEPVAETDRAELMNHCPAKTEVQRKDIFDVLATYQMHLLMVYRKYASDDNAGINLVEILAMLDSWGLVDASKNFAKPQIEPMFAICNRQRLDDYVTNGVSIVTAKAAEARQLAEDARQHADSSEFQSDIGKRAAKSQALKLEHLAQEAEHYAYDVKVGREQTPTLPDALYLNEFVAFLVMAAHRRFENVLNVHDSFLWFLKSYILEDGAVKLVDDDMLGEMQDPDLQAALSAQRIQLRQIHQQYGTLKSGDVTLSLSQWTNMLRTTKLSSEDLGENHQRLSQREGRFLFLSVMDRDSAVTIEQPKVGAKPSSVFKLGFNGFVEAVCRMARELTNRDLISVPLSIVVQEFLLEVFIPKTLQITFFELKKTALKFKRKTKAKVANAGGKVTERLGMDVAAILAEQSKLRTALFSVLANYPIDDESVALLLVYLAEVKLNGVSAELTAELAAKIQRGCREPEDKPTPNEKDFIKPFALDMSSEQEMMAIDLTLTKAETQLGDIFVFYGSGYTLDMSAPEGTMDFEGFVHLLLDTGLVPFSSLDLPPAGERTKKQERQAEQAEAARTATATGMATQLLNMSKAARALTLAKAAAVTGASVAVVTDPSAKVGRWLRLADAHQELPPDRLTFAEFKPLLVRLAYDRFKAFRGTDNRLKQLIQNCFGLHWCLSFPYREAAQIYSAPPVKLVLKNHTSTLKKLSERLCKGWEGKTIDARQLLLFFLACKIKVDVPKARYLIFCARRKPTVQTITKIEDVFHLAIELVCHLDLQENPPKIAKETVHVEEQAGVKGAKGSKGQRGAPKAARGGQKDKNDVGQSPQVKMFEAWMTSRILMMGWDFGRLEKAMGKHRKKSVVSEKLAWTRRKSPAQLAKEKLAKDKKEAEAQALAERLSKA